MNDRKMLTAKEVGLRIKERRNELKISMPELGRRVGVNKSTIQRYETDGVNPTRSMVINGLAEALLTTPEWLTGLSEEKEYSVPTLCENELTEHIRKYLDTVTSAVKGDGHQQLMTTFPQVQTDRAQLEAGGGFQHGAETSLLFRCDGCAESISIR